MTADALTSQTDEQLVLEVLAGAGPRGASHEDFVEAGLAGEYIAVLHRLVDEDGLKVRTDFTSGQPRWVVSLAA